MQLIIRICNPQTFVQFVLKNNELESSNSKKIKYLFLAVHKVCKQAETELKDKRCHPVLLSLNFS